MNTDRTFDPAQQGDMNATRRINVGDTVFCHDGRLYQT